MSSAPLPEDETTRIQTLRSYEILDTEPEQEFDDLALLASHICRTPVAMITLIDEHRQWFKAKVGSDVSETP
ncbi:MAG TPA: diguanylate cyclase, partial [Thermoanaerobaculia bacterium]